jgi:hypothetical protein
LVRYDGKFPFYNVSVLVLEVVDFFPLKERALLSITPEQIPSMETFLTIGVTYCSFSWLEWVTHLSNFVL